VPLLPSDDRGVGPLGTGPELGDKGVTSRRQMVNWLDNAQQGVHE
jgi:hypothetical protein